MAHSNNPFGQQPSQPPYEFAGELRNPFLPQPGASSSSASGGAQGGQQGWQPQQPPQQPHSGGFRPSSSFGMQLQAEMQAQYGQQQSQQAGGHQQGYGGYNAVQEMDPFSSLGQAQWAQAPPAASHDSYSGQSGPLRSTVSSSSATSEFQKPRGATPQDYLRQHRQELEAFDPYHWKQLSNCYDDLKAAWEERRSLIMRALDGNLSPQDGDRAQTLLREADLNIDGIVAATFQLQEAKEGWQQSTDTASKQRVRQQLNVSLRSLPEWPEKVDAQRLAEQAHQPQQSPQQPQGFDPYNQHHQQQYTGQQPGYLGYQQTGYMPPQQQSAPYQRPAFTGAPQTWTTL